jgi:hypothetical protein
VNASTVITLAEGYLLSVAITSVNAASFGQTYASAFVGQGSVAGAPPSPSLMLVADYPTTTIPVGWPGVPIRQTAQGQGFFSSVQIANPGAGAGFTFTALTGLRTRIHSVGFILTTSASVGNRTGRLILTDSGVNTVAQPLVGGAQVASQQWFYTFGLGASAVFDANSLTASAALPLVDLLGGWKLQSFIFGMFAGDSITNIFLTMETFVA